METPQSLNLADLIHLYEGRIDERTPPPPKESPTGGSAANTFKGGGEKSIADMTLEKES